jgi:hypothetical protein
MKLLFSGAARVTWIKRSRQFAYHYRAVGSGILKIRKRARFLRISGLLALFSGFRNSTSKCLGGLVQGTGKQFKMNTKNRE